MLVRQDFCFQPEMPPKPFMMQVMGSLLHSYCFLWERKNEENVVTMSWKDLSRYYDKKSFRTNLRKLNNEGLLSYDESSAGVHIELVGYDEVINER